ncbi:MAG: C4-dicarboxylate TRAP transporter substrate-binding protein [Proteobacteria bacterium]|nr:C4-dicarboxylate TRAP transporter substrate-binding protein [Pseudomonadota bacterium]
MKYSRVYSLTVLTVLAPLALGVNAAEAVDFKYNNWMPPKSLEGKILPQFARDLKKRTGGGVSMKVYSGGQLLGARATLGGIRDGVTDVGFIVPSINASELPHVAMLPDLLPFARDGRSAQAAADETILLNCPECREDFAKQNAVWLAGFGPTPWKFMCKNPIRNLADIAGRRTRVTGGMATRMILALGGIGVNMNPPAINQAMQKGQIDCTFGPIDWMAALRLKDVVKTVVDVDLGVFHGLGWFVVNRDSLNKMSAKQKATLKTMLPQWSARYTNAYQALGTEITASVKAQGIEFWKPTGDVVDALAKYKSSEIVAVAADARKRGVKDPEGFIKRHLATLRKWEGIIDKVGTSDEAYAKALEEHIYSKIKL